MGIFAAQGCVLVQKCVGKTNVFSVLDRINLLWVRVAKENSKFHVTIRCKNTFHHFLRNPNELGNK
jgi:hypothetical protein